MISRSPARERFQVQLGRLQLTVESGDPAFNQVFRDLYRVGVLEAAPAVTDLVLQLRQESAGHYRWMVDGTPDEGLFTLDLALANLEWAIHDALSAALLPAVTVHAAVAMNAAGDGVVLVGKSGSGKSTLLAGLVAAGWTLYADEFFVIEPGGIYLPMPGVITLKGAAIDLIRSRSRDLIFSPTVNDPLRGPIAHVGTPRKAGLEADFRPRALFFPQFQAGSPVVVSRLDTASAFFRLADQSHNYHLLGAPAFRDLVQLARFPAFALEFGDLDAGLDVLTATAAA